MDSHSPYLDFEGASARLKSKFNVDLAPRTIENKVYANEIPSTSIAGQRRIHEDELDTWALGVEAASSSQT